MLIFKAVNGQSLADVCMNTYGTMDYFVKLLQDNNIANANQLPYTGQQFKWDETLVKDGLVQISTANGSIKYATSSESNNNTFYIVGGTPAAYQPPAPSGGAALPVGYYQKTSSTSYTATADGESVITFIALQGKDILQIEREIKPLLTTDYSFNKTTGVLTLINSLSAGETLFILYTEIIKP
jgi:hypothetical protein